jgi:hypothetical protein
MTLFESRLVCRLMLQKCTLTATQYGHFTVYHCNYKSTLHNFQLCNGGNDKGYLTYVPNRYIGFYLPGLYSVENEIGVRLKRNRLNALATTHTIAFQFRIMRHVSCKYINKTKEVVSWLTCETPHSLICSNVHSPRRPQDIPGILSSVYTPVSMTSRKSMIPSLYIVLHTP